MARGHLKCWKHFSGEWGPHLSPISPRNCCKSFERSVRAWTTSARLSIFLKNTTQPQESLCKMAYVFIRNPCMGFFQYTTLLRKYCITISKENGHKWTNGQEITAAGKVSSMGAGMRNQWATSFGAFAAELLSNKDLVWCHRTATRTWIKHIEKSLHMLNMQHSTWRTILQTAWRHKVLRFSR